MYTPLYMYLNVYTNIHMYVRLEHPNRFNGTSLFIYCRSFVVECLSPIRRIAFNMNREEGLGGHPSKLIYIVSWIVITAALIFYLYWIFAWGVKNGGKTLKAWGSVLGVSEVQSIFLVGITKIYILQYLPTELMQPQLRLIRRVLTDVSLDYLNRHDPTEGS
jgi:hypothetical protein